ncbi:hypothetical protein HK102_013337 [Quaeritorhiza haematococci]|nr:hypothetical protein HK102_013337 [Quaeritorhiza haematococci]
MADPNLDSNLVVGEGTVAIVTGGSAGIGKITVRELAKLKVEVYVFTRSREKTAPIVERIREETNNPNVIFVQCDLADLSSVKAAADSFLSLKKPLHLLINNAGIGNVQGLSAQGFEITFATNVLGHYLLTRKLLPVLKASTPARIINLSSTWSLRATSPYDYSTLRNSESWIVGRLNRYGDSKMGNVLFTKALVRRLKDSGVTAFSVHPGVVASEIWRAIPWPLHPLVMAFMRTEEEGAETTMFVATQPTSSLTNGEFYADCAVLQQTNPLFTNDEAVEDLWQKCEEFCREFLE